MSRRGNHRRGWGGGGRRFGIGLPVAFRADLGVVGTSPVLSWANQGTASANATASDTPLLNASDAKFKGYPSVDFQQPGNSDYFTANGVAAVFTGAAYAELVVTLRSDSLVANQYILSNSALGFSLFLSNTGLMHCYTGAGIYGRFAWPDTNGHVLRVIFDGSKADNATRLVLRLDGAAQSLTFAGTIPAALPTLEFTRFGYSTGGGAGIFFDGAIAELLGHTASLAAQEVAAIARYF